MKKAAGTITAISVILCSLLLTGCQDLPTSLEDIIGWREKFLLPLTIQQIQTYVGDILAIIVVIVGIRGLFGLVKDSANKIPLIEGRLGSSLMLIVSAILIYLLIPFSNWITVDLMPADLTIDKLLGDLHLDLLVIDPVKMITQVWAVNFSIVLPLLVEYALLSSLIFTLGVLVISAIWELSKALWITISIWIGHTLFLKTFIMVEGTMGNTHPTWSLADVGNTSSGFFIGITLAALGFCYFVIPMAGLWFGPNFVGPRVHGSEKESENRPRRKINFEQLIPILIPTSQPPPQAKSEPKPPPSHQEEDVVDGEYREVPAYNLGPAHTGLLPPHTGDSSADRANPPPSPDSPPDSGGHPDSDWVPPINISNSKPEPRSSAPSKKSDDDPIIDGRFSEVHPKSEKIHRLKSGLNHTADVTKTGASALGRPGIAATIQTVQSAGNAVLDALEAREKTRESNNPDPDWAPPLKKGGL